MDSTGPSHAAELAQIDTMRGGVDRVETRPRERAGSHPILLWSPASSDPRRNNQLWPRIFSSLDHACPACNKSDRLFASNLSTGSLFAYSYQERFAAIFLFLLLSYWPCLLPKFITK